MVELNAFLCKTVILAKWQLILLLEILDTKQNTKEQGAQCSTLLMMILSLFFLKGSHVLMLVKGKVGPYGSSGAAKENDACLISVNVKQIILFMKGQVVH